MKQTRLSRRAVLTHAGRAVLGGTIAMGMLSETAAAGERRPQSGAAGAGPFRYCFNTSTIQGQKVPLVKEIEIAGQAGYDAIEPWMGEIDRYVEEGGSLADLNKRIKDAGLTVESAIGFFEWIVDDDARRTKGLEQARRDMDRLAQIGARRVAAPPIGAHEAAKTGEKEIDLLAAAERYRALLDVGKQAGVVPQVEVWGFSRTLSRLGQAALVAVESGHADACILADVYHLHKGGSPASGLRLLEGARMHVFHVNDYPAAPPPAAISDADRVYPGDGVAPLGDIFRTLRDIGFRGHLSLELFNRDYWKQDALAVARTGLEKTKTAVKNALA